MPFARSRGSRRSAAEFQAPIDALAAGIPRRLQPAATGGIVSPMERFRLLRDHLVDSGLTTDAANLHPEPRAADILAQAHDRSYIEHCCIGDMSRDKLRRLALPVVRDWRSAPCAQSA